MSRHHNVMTVCLLLLSTVAVSTIQGETRLSCGQSAVTLTGTGDLVISNDTQTCDWTLHTNAGYDLKLLPKVLCISCADQLRFTKSSQVVWDVQTVAGQDVGDLNHKVCNRQMEFCQMPIFQASGVTGNSLQLHYERHGADNIYILFKYEAVLVAKTTPKPKSSFQPKTSPNHGLTTDEGNGRERITPIGLLIAACMTLSALAYR